MVLTLLVLLAGPVAGGEVRLPLRDYVALVEAAEKTSARAPAAAPGVAQVATHHTRVVIGEDDVADVTVVAEVEARGAALKPVEIAVPGTVSRAVVEPAGAVLSRRDAALLLVPARPGRYRVTVSARAPLAGPGAARALVLPATGAAATRVAVEMAPETAWSSTNAILLEDEVRGGRRQVAFTTEGGNASRIELRRDVRGGEADRTLARAVAVTLLDVGRDHVRRHDLLLHEVRRGELLALEATLPEGYEPDVTATDEGVATLPARSGRVLTVPRERRLDATGYLALSQRVPLAERLALPMVEPRVPLRARYLAVSSARVAAAEPQPREAWVRVDLSDLPEPLRSDAPALGIFAAWRERGVRGPRSVELRVPPAAALADPPIHERSTTTLVTTEGRVLHRERLRLDGVAESVDLDIGTAELWSAVVDDEAVSPLTQGTVVRVPLSGRAGVDTTVEVVTVAPLALPSEGSLDLVLPRVAAPVLEHSWRVLLPAERRYRIERSTLRRAAAPREDDDAAAIARVLAARPRGIVRVGNGDAALRGIAVDAEGGVLPGLTVTLAGPGGTRRQATSDAEGRFGFDAIAAGPYEVRCELSGFTSTTVVARPGRRKTAVVTCTMRVAALEETVTVVAEAPSVDAEEFQAARGGMAGGVLGGVVGGRVDEDAQQQFRDEVEELKQGLVGGVRPVPVEVPEDGKLLLLAGALPGPEVSARLDVRKAR